MLTCQNAQKNNGTLKHLHTYSSKSNAKEKWSTFALFFPFADSDFDFSLDFPSFLNGEEISRSGMSMLKDDILPKSASMLKSISLKFQVAISLLNPKLYFLSNCNFSAFYTMRNTNHHIITKGGNRLKCSECVGTKKTKRLSQNVGHIHTLKAKNPTKPNTNKFLLARKFLNVSWTLNYFSNQCYKWKESKDFVKLTLCQS